MLLNKKYNTLKLYQNELFEQLLTNIDNSPCTSIPIILLGDYNIDYNNLDEKQNLDIVVLPYGYTIACQNLPTRLYKSTETLIEYILNVNTAEDRVFDSCFKTDHFDCVLFTVEKTKFGKERSSY